MHTNRICAVVFLVLPTLVTASVVHNVSAIATASVFNELKGCGSTKANFAVEFMENGEREFGLVKFSFSQLEDLVRVSEVILYLKLVDSDAAAHMDGRLQVQIVKNDWDPESLTCNNIPESNELFRPRKLSSNPWDSVFSLDVTNEVKQLIRQNSHVLSLLIFPEENSGEVHLEFGIASAANDVIMRSPVLQFRFEGND
jgi:hypothetical protein